jgi:hypothetical protein
MGRKNAGHQLVLAKISHGIAQEAFLPAERVVEKERVLPIESRFRGGLGRSHRAV